MRRSRKIERNIKEEKSPGFMKDGQGMLWYKGRICVPNIKELKDKILCEAHESAYSTHPGRNKMYHDHKSTYWWYGIKRDVAKYVALYDIESRPSINNLLDYCNPYKYSSESWKRLLRILSWDCLGLSLDMIPFG
jgi:hypothetical protein